MPAYTSTNKIPYPLDSERVADYPTVARNAANRIDELLPVDNMITIGGKQYQATGVFQQLPSFTFTSNPPAYYQTITLPVPYEPPPGYGFAVHVVQSQGYTYAHAQPVVQGQMQVRIVQIGANLPSALQRLGWTLVKADA